MISDKFVILGVVVGLVGTASYIRSIIARQAKPNLVSWSLWAFAPMIAFAAEIHQGVGLRSLTTFAAGFSPLLVLITAYITKNSLWQLKFFDYLCGFLSIIGLIGWLVTGKGNVAIFFAILADTLAALPTVIKCYRFPETENHMAYTLFIFNSGITLLTINQWDFQQWGFPVYLLSINSLIAALIAFKVGPKLSRYADKKA